MSLSPPPAPKENFTGPQLFGEHCSAGWKTGSGAVLPKTSLEKDHAFIFFFQLSICHGPILFVKIHKNELLLKNEMLLE